MTTFVGIDLGTTNTSIATYDGRRAEVRKTMGGAFGQSDTTPSAISMLIRDNFEPRVGIQAYMQVPHEPNNVQRKFKRLLGTGSPIEFASAGVTKSAEWCSSLMLKTVFQYLPLAIRNDPETSVVITVPAGFGQVKNEATLKAAADAGITNAKLMPEPVAACLAVMNKHKGDKTFLVYDLGGGTFDASVARFKKGSGSIIAQGGIESCGGSDWDLAIVRRLVIPWICNNYEIDEDEFNDTHVMNALAYYVESAKIALSNSFAIDGDENASINLRIFPGDLKRGIDNPVVDESGSPIGVDLDITKQDLDELISEFIGLTVNSTKTVLRENGLEESDIDMVVFIGGPTKYLPLRTAVCSALGIEHFDQEVDPMTAVAIGAAIYAESLDWKDGTGKPAQRKKREKDEADETFPLAVEFDSRVTDKKAKVTLTLDAALHTSAEVEIQGVAFGTGLLNVTFSKEVNLTLAEDGPNVFTIIARASGQEYTKQITITRGIEINGIVAARSLFFEVYDLRTEKHVAERIVNVGDQLPKSGTFTVKAGRSLIGVNKGESISFRIYEGSISDVLEDNTFVGKLELSSDLLDDLDVVSKGDELVCDYQITDALGLVLNITIPSIGSAIGPLAWDKEAIKNPREDWEALAQGAISLKTRMETHLKNYPDVELEAMISQLKDAIDVLQESRVDEQVQVAAERVRQIRERFWVSRKASMPEILKRKFTRVNDYFNTDFDGRVKESATASEKRRFEQIRAKAYDAADSSSEAEFDEHHEAAWDVVRDIIWRSPWWIENRIKDYISKGGTTGSIAKKGQDALDASEFELAKSILADIIRNANKKDAPEEIPHK